MDTITKLKDKVLAMKREYEKQVEESGQEIVKEILKEFFDENPEIYGVKWRQYTPYFNDGEACEFGVKGIDEVLIKKEQTLLLKDPEDDMEEGDSVYSDCIWISEYYLSKPIREKIDKISETLSEIQDCLYHVFGDHAKVKATKTEITYDEFSHD